VGIMTVMRKKSGIFPLDLHMEDLENDGWQFKIYVSTNPYKRRVRAQ
jgi:hypothetical protein